ncbi:MAG: nicotinate phosphoribosyltransferase [Planctomycetota bacterium]
MNEARENDSLSLLTDLYQLTMAYGYWRHGRAEQPAVFHLFFRRNPFKGGYTIAAGLEPVLQFLSSFRFEAADVDFLRTVRGNDNAPLFDDAFLNYLGQLELTLDVDAVPEGTVVFPHEPLLRIRGPILQCQLLETALLNIVNFQSLIATKAARVVSAAGGDDVLEFGLRRAQGIDGALAASRAAYIGGCAATSNVLAGKRFGIPIKGTHAHSWVMSFDTEPSAFAAYAEALPNNCVFLVDTYDTLQGVHHAIETGRVLRERGHRMVGIRLDSGDLGGLSQKSRKLLDDAGFEDAAIVASNDLDERTIQSLKQQGAAINVWGVGTKLVTAYDQPALGGVYKLGAIRDDAMNWVPKMKLSEEPIKSSTPGVQQVRRFYDAEGEVIADMIYNELQPPGVTPTLIDPLEPNRRIELSASQPHEDMLVPVFRGGEVTYQTPSLADVRDRTFAERRRLKSSIQRFDHPDAFLVGLEEQLYEMKVRLSEGAQAESRSEEAP